jgi:hypothetical protein
MPLRPLLAKRRGSGMNAALHSGSRNGPATTIRFVTFCLHLAGLLPPSALTIGCYIGRVASVGRQRSSAVEQCFRKAKVAGSIPAAGSSFLRFQVASLHSEQVRQLFDHATFE